MNALLLRHDDRFLSYQEKRQYSCHAAASSLTRYKHDHTIDY